MNVFINTLVWCGVEANLQIVIIDNMLVKGKSHLNTCELNSLHRKLQTKPMLQKPFKYVAGLDGDFSFSTTTRTPHFITF